MDTVTFKAPTGGVLGQWPKLKLKPEYEKPWDETRAAMLYVQPAFTDIWYSMMIDRDGQQAWFTDQIPTCGTDDKILYINPEFFFKKTLDERIFICAHEIMHAVLNHMGIHHALKKEGWIRYPDGAKLPVSMTLLNVAADYVINDMLVTARVGKLPEDGLHDPKEITGDMSVIDAYRKLYKKIMSKRPKRPGKQGGGGGGGKPGKQKGQPGDQPGGGNSESEITEQEVKEASKNKDGGQGQRFDEHLEPGTGRGKTPTEATSERNPQQWENAVTAAMQSAKLRGNLPGNLERLFSSTLEPKADWTDLYGIAVTRALGNDAYSWEFLDPQMVVPGPGRASIGAPGRVKFGCELIVIVVDTSGSITQAILDQFMAETRGILEQVRPRLIIFCQCDYSIQEWTEIDDVSDLGGKLKGGGGTSFKPPFERLEKEMLEPDMLVYLTDLYGDFPAKKPDYPVIWGVIDNKENAPWGTTVHIPLYND